jgi:hypothetical protein
MFLSGILGSIRGERLINLMGIGARPFNLINLECCLSIVGCFWGVHARHLAADFWSLSAAEAGRLRHIADAECRVLKDGLPGVIYDLKELGHG